MIIRILIGLLLSSNLWGQADPGSIRAAGTRDYNAGLNMPDCVNYFIRKKLVAENERYNNNIDQKIEEIRNGPTLETFEEVKAQQDKINHLERQKDFFKMTLLERNTKKTEDLDQFEDGREFFNKDNWYFEARDKNSNIHHGFIRMETKEETDWKWVRQHAYELGESSYLRPGYDSYYLCRNVLRSAWPNELSTFILTVSNGNTRNKLYKDVIDHRGSGPSRLLNNTDYTKYHFLALLVRAKNDKQAAGIEATAKAQNIAPERYEWPVQYLKGLLPVYHSMVKKNDETVMLEYYRQERWEFKVRFNLKNGVYRLHRGYFRVSSRWDDLLPFHAPMSMLVELPPARTLYGMGPNGGPIQFRMWNNYGLNLIGFAKPYDYPFAELFD